VKVLIVTWQGGGATQPAFGLGRMLAERCHDVRIIGPDVYADRAAAAGCRHRPFTDEIEFDPTGGRAVEDQVSYLDTLFFGTGLEQLVAGELEAEPADVVVVDCLLRAALAPALASGSGVVLLFHLIHRFHGNFSEGDGPWSTAGQIARNNESRARFGLPPLPLARVSASSALIDATDASIVALSREFDDWPDPPANVAHVGPIFEEGGADDWHSPWSPGDDRPLVVVSLGSGYMHQEELLTRIASALTAFDVRALILTGLELAPDELHVGPDIHLRDFVPHAALLPDASLVITHAGTGTILAAFAAGVPMVCLPLGRDQALNAARAAELGCARVLERDATVEQIRAAIGAALEAEDMRASARRMAAATATYMNGQAAIEIVAKVASSR
jgi:UDP:flavonoid glycosyltransferase YjiC (YdhE family)